MTIVQHIYMHLDAIRNMQVYTCSYISSTVCCTELACMYMVSVGSCAFTHSSLLLCFRPLCRRWLVNNPSIVLSQHTFLAVAPHLSYFHMSIPVNFCSLFTQHPNSNPPASYQFYHMILHYVEFRSYCGIGERRSIMGEKLIDIRLWRWI